MCREFKNPEEPDSEADELDELVDDVDEFGVPVVVQAVDDLDGSANELDGVDQMPYQDYDDEVEDEDDDEDISSDGSFDPNATDSDDSMYDTNDDETEEPVASKSNRHTKNSNGDDATGSSSAKDTQNKASGEEATGSTVYELNEEDEDDDTVRAMIAALKKPRSTPPEIKLEDFITDICFHPERDIIALATITGDICLYEYANEGNTLLRTIEVHAKACRDIEFSDDGRNILSCSKDKSIMVTDMETEKLKKFYESAHDDAINKLYVLDENLFATGDDGGTVKLWDLRTKDAIFALKEVEDYISQIISNDAKKLLLVTSGDGYLTTFNIGARKMYVQSEPYEEELTCMGIYRGDSKLVVGTSKGRMYTYNWGQFGYHCDMYPGVKSSISEMIPITDRICCVAGDEGVIRACHIAPFRCLGVVGQHNMPVESLDICNNGELIASSSHNNDIRFWNVKYFEDFGDIKYNEKHNTHKEKQHNLPSSKLANASDFFADLAKPPSDNEC